jgi:DNA-binding GntR family transcriptional regulator
MQTRPSSREKISTGEPPAAAVRRASMRGESVSAAIGAALRADIVALRRKPGEAISEKDIAARFGVSRTPVREALLRLKDENLVEIVPQSGTFVARISVPELVEAIVVRTSLEGTMARLAAERGDAAGLDAVEETLERQEIASSAGDREAFHQADEDFHSAIAEAAGHPRVWGLVQTVKIQLDRYRRLTLPVPGRMATVIAEHRPILAALRARDPERAAAAMASHLEALRGFADARFIPSDYLVDDRRDGEAGRARS